MILGLSFYARKWLGVKTWRMMHRSTLAVYVLALGHVIGAGTNGHSWWMLAMLTALTAPIVFGFTYRMLPAAARRPVKRGSTDPETRLPVQPRLAGQHP